MLYLIIKATSATHAAINKIPAMRPKSDRHSSNILWGYVLYLIWNPAGLMALAFMGFSGLVIW